MDLLRLELYKLLPYRTFWLILGLYIMLIVLLVYSSQSITINDRQLGTASYQFPALWQNLTYIAGFFNALLGILLIVLVTDEYSFKTLRQQVIDGLSRLELVLAKFFVILCVAAFSTFFLLLAGLYFGLLYSEETSASAIFSRIISLVYYLVQAVGVMSLAMLFAFIIKKSGLSIIAFLAYAVIFEPLIRSQLPDSLDKYMPLKVFSSLTPMPLQQTLEQFTLPTTALSPALATLPALLYTVLFLLLSYLVLKLRDL